MKIILNNKLDKKPQKTGKPPKGIVEIILTQPTLQSYLSSLTSIREITEIYVKSTKENLGKGNEIKIKSIEEILQLAGKLSDHLVVRKSFTSRADMVNSLKDQFLVLICDLTQKNDEIFQEIFEYIELPDLDMKFEVFLIKSSYKNQERVLKKARNEWELLKNGKISTVSWTQGIKSLIKNHFTINLLCLAESTKEDTSSIHSIFAIKQKYEEKHQERKAKEAQNTFQDQTQKFGQIYSKPLKYFWLCENCSFPNSLVRLCGLCGSAISE